MVGIAVNKWIFCIWRLGICLAILMYMMFNKILLHYERDFNYDEDRSIFL